MSTNIAGTVIVDIVRQSFQAAGIAGIFKFADPRAVAIATAAGAVTQEVFVHVVSNIYGVKTPGAMILTVLAGTATGMIVSSKVGKIVDPNFKLLKLLGVQIGIGFAAGMVGYVTGVIEPSKN